MTHDRTSPDLPSLLDDLVRRARAQGADAADALAVSGHRLAVRRRMRRPEQLERSESFDVGLRVFVGRRQAVVSSNDLRPATLATLVERAVDMARLVPEDPYAGLAEPGDLATSWPDLDLADGEEPGPERLIALADACEGAALDVPGVTNSEGADAGWGRTEIALATSSGFAGAYARTGCSVSVSVIAGAGTEMETDYDYSSAVHLADLRPAETVGRRAGERAVARLKPRKVATARVPVVFDRRLSGGLIGSLLGAISGAAIARGTSFLKDRMGQQILPDALSLLEDPFVPRGRRSRPFDAEGLAPRPRALVENGTLTTWLLDLRSARQLGLAPTGHASRGTGGPPGPAASNVRLTPGTMSPEALLAEIGTGLYVTDLLGSGVNLVTGDYSRGAAGFWIEGGVKAYPVSEVTVAGNLADMLRSLTPADDLEILTGVDAPTLAVAGMTVAGV